MTSGRPGTAHSVPRAFGRAYKESKRPLPTSPRASHSRRAAATDGLRNITGRVNKDGAVSIWAVTSTVSENGDQGAGPNRLVKITDALGGTTLPAGERFTTVRTAGYGEVLRGVSFTPGTGTTRHHHHRWF